MSKLTPSLEQRLDARAARTFGAMDFLHPATVVTYYPDRQCVDAAPVVTDAIELEDGSTRQERRPVVLSAPVIWPGAGGAGFTFAIKPGDVVMLVFPSASTALWLAVGGFAEAQDGRRHDLSSAFAIPGGHSFRGRTAPKMKPAATGATVHASTLRLGESDASDPVVRKSDLDAVVAKLNLLITKYNAHTHAVGSPPATPETTITAPSCSSTVFSK